MIPAYQHLEANDTSIARIDLGLVMQHHLSFGESAAQFAGELDPCTHLGIHRFREEVVSAATLGLRFVERKVGMRKQRLTVCLRIANYDANAGPRLNLVFLDQKWLTEVFNYFRGQYCCIRGILDIDLKNRKLVTTKARHHVTCANGIFKPLAHQNE